MKNKKTKKRWTKKEIDYLKKNYPKGKNSEMAKFLDRSRVSICCQAYILGLRKIKHFWNEKEIKFLKNNFHRRTREQLVKRLNKSRSAIINKMHSLNLQNWNIVPNNYKMNRVDLSYLAGILDGEGSIMLVKIKKKDTTIHYTPAIQIHNCSLLFRDWFLNKGFKVRKEIRSKDRWQDKYIVSIRGYRIKHLLKLLIPYLVLKKPQAYLMIKWIEERQTKLKRSAIGIIFKETPKMKELRENIKKLNSKNREELYPLEKRIIKQMKGGKIKNV